MKKIILIVSISFFFSNNYSAAIIIDPITKIDLLKLTEEEKITKLILHIKNLKGATFIRNGNAYTPAQAAEHLTMKRKKADSKVKTAIEFIVYCASKSSSTGKYYLVKFSEEKTIKAIDFLLEELKRIEKENK